jgi:Tfp pilus assembly protein PilN
MSRAPEAILRPGPEAWELWKLAGREGPQILPEVTAKALGAFRHLLLALPSRSILSVPLWVSSEGDKTELAELELSSRHLLRKGAETHSVPILEQDGRSLVLALASSDDPVAADYFKAAKSFEFPARLLPAAGADIVVWRELGDLCFAFYRDDHCVFFASSGEPVAGPAFCGAVLRTALRLRAEGVIPRIPAKLRLLGNFSDEECTSLGHALRIDWEHEETVPAPLVPEVPSDPAPPTARMEIQRRGRLRRVGVFAAIGLSVYAFLLLVVAADLLWQRVELRQLAAELAAIDAPAREAQTLVTSWNEFRPALDPSAFAIDQLDAVASQIPGEQVRLTQYNQAPGRITVAGEAADVSQAYEFFEKVKKVPALQDYDWTNRQPQLAGRNKVRFEMEGMRPDAKSGEE